MLTENVNSTVPHYQQPHYRVLYFRQDNIQPSTSSIAYSLSFLSR